MVWNPARLPRQPGRVFVVTGGNGGLGYFAAEQLAATGARVILASRNAARAQAAKAAIAHRVEGAYVDRMKLDLASLESVRFAGEELGEYPRLDGLVLNGGITSPPRHRETTEDGLELVMGTNYLGHFALTALAWPALARTEGARLVGVGSLATRVARLDAEDLLSEQRYRPFDAYAQSKHAVHGFVLELARRLEERGASQRALLAHPGLAIDSLTSSRSGIVRQPSEFVRLLAFGAQGKNRGATPIVRALLDADAANGTFFGPSGGVKGKPVEVHPAQASASPSFGEVLWTLSERWTHTPFPL